MSNDDHFGWRRIGPHPKPLPMTPFEQRLMAHVQAELNKCEPRGQTLADPSRTCPPYLVIRPSD
jgi:hypothetical protein